MVDRTVWVDQDGASKAQVGDLDDFEEGEIRGFRFGTVGRINLERPWNYTLFAATNAFDKGFDDDLTLFDARLDIPVFGEGVLSLGKQKEPISMERINGGAYLPMQERSIAADALLPARNVGAVLSGPAIGGEMSWAVGVFNDWLDDGGSISDNATQVIGRITGVPAHTADDSNLLHVGLGIRYSDTEEGGTFIGEPEINLAPLFIDTGPLAADGLTTFDVELAWRRGPLWVAAESIWSEIDSSALGDPTLRGHYLQAAYTLTGEMRKYDRRNGTFGAAPVARPADTGGSGTWEVAARWSALDATDAGVQGGDIDILSLGVNWWVTRTFALSVNYRWIELDRDGLDGSSEGLTARILLLL